MQQRPPLETKSNQTVTSNNPPSVAPKSRFIKSVAFFILRGSFAVAPKNSIHIFLFRKPRLAFSFFCAALSYIDSFSSLSRIKQSVFQAFNHPLQEAFKAWVGKCIYIDSRGEFNSVHLQMLFFAGFAPAFLPPTLL